MTDDYGNDTGLACRDCGEPATLTYQGVAYCDLHGPSPHTIPDAEHRRRVELARARRQEEAVAEAIAERRAERQAEDEREAAAGRRRRAERELAAGVHELTDDDLDRIAAAGGVRAFLPWRAEDDRDE